MSEQAKNLTTPEEIIHAFLVKGSRDALSKFASKSKWSRPYISQNIHGHRRNDQVLLEIANHLGCGVYGVMPQRANGDLNA